MRFLMLNWRDPLNPLAGGAERVSHRYLRALQERGHEVAWFANTFPGARPDAVEGVRVHRGGGRGTSVIAAQRWFARQPRFDLVIDQHHGIPWYAPWWCGTRCVAYIHEVLGPIWNSFFGFPWSALGRLQETLTHVAYGGVPFWTPSESTARRLRNVGVSEVKVLPNGVDTRALTELPDKPLSSPLRLITVSRLAPNKRVDHAIGLVAELTRRGVSSELAIVGGGECEVALREQVERTGMAGRVRFTGRLNEADKNAALERAHFLVHPSQREGWGLNVIEANALGTPALVYPVDGLVDSTVKDVTGLIAATEEPAAMADELCGIAALPDRFATLRRAAWRRAGEYQWDRVLPAACDWLETQARRDD